MSLMSDTDVIAAHHNWAAAKLKSLASDKAVILSHHNWAKKKLAAVEQDRMIAQSHIQWANIQRARAAAEGERLRRLSARTTINTRMAMQLQRVHEEVLALAMAKPTPRPATNPMKAANANHETVVSNKDMVMEELRRMAARRANRVAALHEQEERVAAMKMDQVLENLVRSVNSKRVALQSNIEKVRRCDPTNDLVRDEKLLDAFNSTLEVIPRKATVDAVITATLDEQARRTQRHIAFDVFTELEKKSNQRIADEAMDNERARRITTANMQPVLEQLIRKNNSLVATFLCDQEQIRRCQERSLYRPTVCPTDLLTSIVQTATKKAVCSATADEQARRVQEIKGRAVFSTLIRVVAQRNALQAMEAERVDRITRDYFSMYVLPAIVRHGAIKTAVALTEEERDRRVALDCASWTPGPKKILTRQAAHWRVVLSDVRRVVAQRAVLAAMATEAERRVRQDYFTKRVLVELMDRIIRQNINEVVATEQAQQVTRNYLVHSVHPEYFQALRVSFAVDMAEKERKRRMTEAKPNPPDGLHAIHESLVRAHNAKVGVQEMENERARRIRIDQYQPVVEQIVRVYAQRQAKQEASLEQARRVATALMHGVVSEISRMVRSAEVDMAMDAEQLRRVNEPGFRATRPWPHPSHFRAFGAAGSFQSELVESSH